jgi:hypothetical protein
MNLREVLKMADDIVFAKTGEHIDDLQETILRGTMQGEKYTKIAEESHCNESYVRDVGSKLWQILSQELGEEVHKSNLRSSMERWQVSNVSNFAKDVVGIGIFNNCGEARYPPNIPNSNSPNQKTSYQDLSEMPEVGTFYLRTPQLDTLTNWILQQRCRLIALTGISGKRERMIEGLALAMIHLKAAGARTIYIDGSFVTSKPKPIDFDACYDRETVDFENLRVNAPRLFNYSDRAAQKAKYRGEIFPSDQPVGNYGENSFEFFQIDRQQNRKGIIAIDLLRWEP